MTQPVNKRAVTGMSCWAHAVNNPLAHLHPSLLQVLDQTFPHDKPGGERGSKGCDERGLRRRVGLCGIPPPSLLAHLTIWKPQPPADSAQSRKMGSRSCGEVVSWSVPWVSLCHRGGVGVVVTAPPTSITPLPLEEPLRLPRGTSHPLLSDFLLRYP